MALVAGRVGRLRTRLEFERVQRTPDVRLRQTRFLLLAARSEGTPRFGFVASKRLGNAVARNRCKRLLREAARRVTPPLAVDVVLIAHPPLVTSTLAEVLGELEVALRSLAKQLARRGPARRPA